MEKKEIEINGKIITVMEQPSSVVLQMERKFKGGKRFVEHAREILKYPSGKNEPLETLINIPEKITSHGMEIVISSKEEGLKIMEELFLSGIEGFSFLGEYFIKKTGNDVDDFKFKEIEKIGNELVEQVGEIAVCMLVINTFRNM